jgi:hypothetical protein
MGTLAKLSDKPSYLLEEICRHVASGGSLTDYCHALGFSYADVTWWLQRDDERHDRYRKALSARKEWVIEGVLGRLVNAADFNLADICDDEGRILPPNQWPGKMRGPVSTYAESEGAGGKVRRTVKAVDPLKAVELLGKQLGIFKEQIDITGSISLADMVTEAAKVVEKRRDPDSD